MDTLHLFVDGSFIKRRSEMHAGVVAIQNNQIIAESYTQTTAIHEIDYPHEEFAMIVGLNLAKQLNTTKEVFLYSDSLYLVNLLNKYKFKNINLEKKQLYKNKKPFIKKIINLLNYFLSIEIDVIINWVSEEQSIYLKRAHNISRKWSFKNEQLMPIINNEDFLIQKELEFLSKKINKKPFKRRSQFGLRH